MVPERRSVSCSARAGMVAPGQGTDLGHNQERPPCVLGAPYGPAPALRAHARHMHAQNPPPGRASYRRPKAV